MKSLRQALSPSRPSSTSRQQTPVTPNRRDTSRATSESPAGQSGAGDVYSELNRQVNRLLQEEEDKISPKPSRESVAPSGTSGASSTSLPFDPLALPIPRYQPGQTLAPIHTGETLQLDQYEEPPQLHQLPIYPDPFMNPPYDLNGQGYYHDQDYFPPSNNSHDSHEEDLMHEQYMRAGSVDHFGYDTEAYASGPYSRGPHAIPRSRSPTPAVDDEDYYLVEDDSLHYTGPRGRTPEKSGMFDEPPPPLPRTTSWVSTIDPHAPIHDEKSSIYSEPGTPSLNETRHFGPAPMGRVTRRHRSMKRAKVTTEKVKLINGCLVLDIPVAPGLMLPRKGAPEMMHTRYTGITCDPDDFEKKGLFLRQNAYGRRTEMFIVITMYNEDEVLLCRTLYGVMQNIAHLCTRKNSSTWGPESWQKVVVCIVADGRKKIHPRVLDCLSLLGVFHPGDWMKNVINGQPVTAHIFEYTTSFGLDENLKFRYPDKGVVPCQILFCLKEKNQKKINSHRWFFNAFAPLLQPNICILLDVGTRPSNKSLYHLWKAFDLNSNVAGACGEISTYKGKYWKHLLNPLVAAQNFEYKISGILDKPMESMFGYISVLPGAFSAYRYIALQNDENGVGPLASYFKGEVLSGRDTDIFTSNMYLAEDRILCFELVAKRNANWILRYVKSAIGETDVPDSLPEFISQRRRWLNGSFFAATYAIAHVGKILTSGHSVGRKVALMFETTFNIINIVFSWFSVGNFFIFFVVLTSSLEADGFGLHGIEYVNVVAQYLLGSLVMVCFLFSMGNKPQASPWKYKLATLLFSVLMIYMLFASIMTAVAAIGQSSQAYNAMLFSVVITYGLYAVSSVLAFDPWHMVTSFVQYMLLSPTYINILNIYAFSNLDDISWGTKQDSVVESDLGTVVQNAEHKVDVEVLAEEKDYNQFYERALSNVRNRLAIAEKERAHPPPPGNAEKLQAAKDYYANVRTNVLLAWVISNSILVLALLSGGSSGILGESANNRTKAYLIFILVFTAISNIVRFLGSTLYLLVRIFTG